MSLFTDASLVMIPSGVKDGKLYSIKPDDGVGDFTFTRGSNLAATRVDENGLIEKGRENIILQSNQFDTTWTVNIGASITSGQTGYDGSSNAWLLESINITQSNIGQNVSQTDVQTFSVYAKAGTSNWFAIYVFGTPSNVAWFNLGSGALGLNSNGIDSQIESVGSGWYRCSISFNNTPTRVAIFLSDSDSNVNSSLGANIYIQDAQLELGLVATDYIETGATTEQAGILENLPRLDYTDSSCPSLLLEPTRTNLVPQSEPFTGGLWLLSVGGSITSKQAISPEGVQNACKVQGTASNSFIYDVLTLTPSTNYTTSFYIKNIDSVQTQFLAANEQEYDINWDGAEILSVSTDVSYQSLANGWYRVWITKPSNPDGQYITRFYPSNATNSVYLYGYQVELGSYPTSYIPTYGTVVTRSGDLCSVSSGASGILPQGEGTIYVEGTINDTVNTEGYLIRIDETSYNNTIFISRTSTGHLLAAYRNNSVTIFSFQKNDVPDTFKAAFSFESGNSVLYVNGEQIGTSSVTYTPAITYDDVRIGGFNASTANMSGLIKKQIIFKSRLSNTELIALTTI